MDTKSVIIFSPTSFHHRIGGFRAAKSNSKDPQPCLTLTIPCNYSRMRGTKLIPKWNFGKEIYCLPARSCIVCCRREERLIIAL